MDELRDTLALDTASGTRLSLAEYNDDFWARRARVRNAGCWKFERRQHFEETSSGRDAFRQGDLDTATRILEGRRAEFAASVRDDLARGTRFHRLRIVEEPLTPYLTWELRSLQVQAECGKPIRVAGADALLGHEDRGPLPEIVILGDGTLYEVVYTDDGAPEGAVRFDDRAVIEAWTEFVRDLYETAEDVLDYAARVL